MMLIYTEESKIKKVVDDTTGQDVEFMEVVGVDLEKEEEGE